MKRKVVKNPLEKLPEILTKNIEKNLCVCNEIPKKVVINAIANGAETIDEVRGITFATGGNGCCIRQVKRLIECIHSIESEK